MVVNEAGASVYSTSEIGREEFPECDAIQRSAISIGRRLQDPLSELVKIDPASIGVGLYQHDARAKHLRDTLDDVVQSCVSFVGVELNSASTPLLRYVSGMNQLTARRVYEHRQQNGPFRSRQQLLEVSGFGDATFVQAAGFLKIVGGDDPLDATWIHPENYAAAEKLLEKLGVEPASRRRRHERGPHPRAGRAARSAGAGRRARHRPADARRHDRGAVPSRAAIRARTCRRRSSARTSSSSRTCRPGMELRGTVLNVVDFGAFVDVGLSDSGLVHISQLSAGYVRDPHDVVAVGDQVRVWVASIDKERRRVALTMIAPGTERPQAGETSRSRGAAHDGPHAAGSRSQLQPADETHVRAGRRSRPPPPRGSGKAAPRSPRPPHAPRPRAPARTKSGPPKTLVPITKEMEEGKEYLRSFGDLLQFHQKKKEQDRAERAARPAGGENGASVSKSGRRGDRETRRSES